MGASCPGLALQPLRPLFVPSDWTLSNHFVSGPAGCAAYLHFANQDVKDFGGRANKGGDDTSFVFPLWHPFSLSALCSHFHHHQLSQIPARPFNAHSQSTKDVCHSRQDTPIPLLSLCPGHLDTVCEKEFRDGGVIQSSREDLRDRLETRRVPSIVIRVVFKGPQARQFNNDPFSVLFNKLPHHSAWWGLNIPFINPITKTQSL